MKSPLKILYVGVMGESEKSRMMAYTFKQLGHHVAVIDSSISWNKRKFGIAFRVLDKVFRYFRYHHDFSAVNKRVRQEALSTQYDVIWFTKVNVLHSTTLEWIRDNYPECRTVFSTVDDLLNRQNVSINTLKALPLFTKVIISNPKNATSKEKAKLKCPNLVWENFFFDETVHRPVLIDESSREKYATDVVFVGTFEKERAENILKLAQAGVQVVVWGNMWPKDFGLDVPSLRIMQRDLSAEQYVKALQCAKIVLGFLRKANRDVVTGRSVEIPGTGAFMVMERTEMHMKMYEEDKEAVFFSTDQELIEKVKYYLERPDLREAIAAAGHQRVHKDSYSYQKRFPRILDYVMSSATM